MSVGWSDNCLCDESTSSTLVIRSVPAGRDAAKGVTEPSGLTGMQPREGTRGGDLLKWGCDAQVPTPTLAFFQTKCSMYCFACLKYQCALEDHALTVVLTGRVVTTVSPDRQSPKCPT